MTKFSTISASLLALAVIGQAHTPSQVERELILRRTVQTHSKRMEKCASSPAAMALKGRAIARRAAKAQELREKRGLLNRRSPGFLAHLKKRSLRLTESNREDAPP